MKPDDHSPWRFCVAPMMDWTDRHCRHLHRILSRRARLYTEMVTAPAVVHGDVDRLLGFDAFEHPVALQLGGSDIPELVRAAQIGEQYGYDEINLNCCCPSDRVQKGRFGACLMLEPGHVASIVAALKAAVELPVTVKCRLGIDRSDEYDFLCRFTHAVRAAGCDALIVHARKAWLKGLSPRQNREIPPLHPRAVHRLKAECPTLPIILNGGLRTLDEGEAHLAYVDGVMLGRAAYEDPWLLADVDPRLFGTPAPVQSRAQALDALRFYAQRQRNAGVPLARMMRHWLGLYRGQPGGRSFRRLLSEGARQADADVTLLHEPAPQSIAARA